MNNKILHIRFKSLDDFKNEIIESVEKRKKNIKSKDEIYFESRNSFRKFMTMQKIELLSAIANLKPTSIYVLAQMLSRDLASVSRDCTSLETTGFITLKEQKNSRNSKTPKLTFNYSSILIENKDNKYSIEFLTAV